MYVRKQQRRRRRVRGAVIVQVAVMSTVIMGFAALAVDIGSMYTVQSELQSVADSAALAAAAQLSGAGGGNAQTNATAAANQYAVKNRANGVYTTLGTADIVFGQAAFNGTSGRYTFAAGGNPVDAVKIIARRADGSQGGALQMVFAQVLGFSRKNMAATAVATLVPRDIVVVIDLSNSMCYDSQLRYYNRTDGGFCNLRDLWCSLNGP